MCSLVSRPQSLHLLCVANHQPSASQNITYLHYTHHLHQFYLHRLLFISSYFFECQHGIRFIFIVLP
ncbi:Uncharacterized protein APZ42_014378 [Daphnia magna]|uniref:Uncharacterized protein n=1 Tax=Daphnia magna TaxID=35525 RepID=A0A162PY83_9CRUS|nr:Uncharacterized protein APZ42_014378 [Daphnia magna]